MLTRLGALRVTDPDAWAREIKAALRAHGGNRTRAAAALGVTHRHLTRWLQDERLASAAPGKPGNPGPRKK